MNFIEAIPLPLRLACLFVLGATIGSFLNLAIYRLAWHRRLISPWSPAPPKVAPRRWPDRIPIFGWLALRRETPVHGRGFWIRPLLVELGTAAALAWLYHWEVVRLALYAPGGLPPQIDIPLAHLHAQYFSHVVLLSLMIVASFIDIDERLIPDGVTVSGTLLALVLAAALPWSLLPQVHVQGAPSKFAQTIELPEQMQAALEPGQRLYVEFLTLTAPRDWPDVLAGFPLPVSLAIGLGCFWFWCFAVAPRPWYPRHGLRRALAVCSARLSRALATPLMLSIITVGTLGIAAMWLTGGTRWAALLSVLVGLAASGGLVWAVRIIGAVTLRKEAMGFGDVLLMMMIGAFLGWQPGLFIFFLAPVAGLVIGIAQYVIVRDQTIPYGPFLCLAAAATVIAWPALWGWSEHLLAAGWLVPAVVLVGLAAMALMLLALRLFRTLFGGA